MFLLTHHTEPQPNHPEFSEVGGAYVNCFIDTDDFDLADSISRKAIEENQWNILKLDESTAIRETSEVDPEKHKYYEQALIDKEVFIFYAYPIKE